MSLGLPFVHRLSTDEGVFRIAGNISPFIYNPDHALALQTPSSMATILSPVLFAAGLLLAILAFFVSNAETYAWVGRLIAPGHFAAQRGLDQLESAREIRSGDEGFPEIVDIVKRHIVTLPANAANIDLIQRAELSRISYSMGSTSLGAGPPVVLVGASFSVDGRDGRINDIDVGVIKRGVSSLGDVPIRRWNAWVFWTGLIFLLLSRVVDNWRDSRPLYS